MQAAVVVGPGKIRIESTAVPIPGEGEVRVRLEGCGVCGSNLAPWEGRPWFKYPLAPGELGHEGWGRIDALGPNAKRFVPGQRVALLSFRAYAEYDVAAESAVIELPETLHGRPFPGEALGCAMNVFRRCAIRRGQTVAILGIGFLGAVLTALSAKAGARVFAISRRKFALETGRRMGAEQTLFLDDSAAVIQRVHELTAGEGCDRVIEAAGQQATLDLGTELTRTRGRLIIAGYHQDGLRQVNLQVWNWRGIDVVNAHERDPQVYAAGIRAATTAVSEGRFDPFPLYTHTFKLAELASALDALKERPDNFMKALIVP